MKKLIIKIIISIVIITLAIIGISLYNQKYKNKKPANNDTTNTETNVSISVTIIAYDIDKNKICDDKYDGNNKTLFDILNENYDIRYDESESLGVRLLDFESIKTDFKKEYIAIYVDNKYSNRGISFIELHDGIIIELKETKL